MARLYAVLFLRASGQGRRRRMLAPLSGTPVIVFGSGLSFSGFGLIADLAGRSLAGAAVGLLLHGLLAGLAAHLALSCLDEDEAEQA